MVIPNTTFYVPLTEQPSLTEVINNFCTHIDISVVRVIYLICFVFLINYIVVPRSQEYFNKYWSSIIPVNSIFERFKGISDILFIMGIFFLLIIVHIQENYYLILDILIILVIFSGLIFRYFEYREENRIKPYNDTFRMKFKKFYNKMSEGYDETEKRDNNRKNI